ncbi:hypothetical protein PILCRDRAFT_113796 [Piloderma croceum F 1598]|uniref:Uncharacterized protein n=1 Tax=Piloderma croceum (strain F 1598) TaxID=765440 RepID=A0A0C3GKR5_PILCF|nr:hypothetical protein PILCRDRAFT_113796 [Piloderma croceum F 1598]
MRYCPAESLSDECRILNTNYLNLNGGRAADRIDHAIHIITNMSQFEGWRKVEDGAVDAAVTTWIDRSIILGKAQLTNFYSANPAMVFSGIVACATDARFPFPIFLLFPNPHHTDDAPDLEVPSAAITALGGQRCTGLTRDVTRLFDVGPGSDMYETDIHFQANMHMKVILPSTLV